jgi:hypothetical protein
MVMGLPPGCIPFIVREKRELRVFSPALTGEARGYAEHVFFDFGSNSGEVGAITGRLVAQDAFVVGVHSR